MLTIISVSRLDNDKLTIRASRPQHYSHALLEYSLEKEVRRVLSALGITEQDHRCAPETVGTDEDKRAIEIPSDGCSKTGIVCKRISIVVLGPFQLSGAGREIRQPAK